MPIIHITPEEELKVFRKLMKAAPVTVFYPGDILIVQEVHLNILDDAGVQYTKKDRDAIRQSRLEWEKYRKQRDGVGIS